ncbi:MAG: ABC transporter substrate-binding protein [Gammaproteobacteria bacterium]|jgi:peptide/nickel transport system substrate-binding protein
MAMTGTYPSLRRRLVFVTVVLCVMAMPGCESHQNAGGIRFGLADSPVTLDPRFATDAISTRINRLIYRRLIDFDEHAMPVPSLASWRSLAPDRFRFHLLEEGRDFHDGSTLTAEDVKATFDSILDPANASPHRATLSMIESVTVVDKDTVDFQLSTPDPLFPGYLDIGILPAKKIAARYPFNTQPVGSGPFQFVSWQKPSRLQLRRRRDGQRFAFVHVKDQNTRVLKLLRGELDMLQNDIDPELIKFLSKQSRITVTTRKGSNFSYLGFNLKDKVVGRRAIRQAIAYAIDREVIIKYLFAGRARPASAVLTPDHWAGDPALPTYKYEPDKARELLSNNGYSVDRPLHIVYKTSNNAFRIRLATIIQSQLADVGIQVDLRTYDWGTFYGDIKAGNFQMYSLSWVGVNLPDIFRYVFHSASVPPNGANRGRFSDQQVDKLLDEARTAQDLAYQAEIYRHVQEILFKKLPYVPLWYEDHVFIAQRSIKGYQVSGDGNYDGLVNVYRITSSETKNAHQAKEMR